MTKKFRVIDVITLAINAFIAGYCVMYSICAVQTDHRVRACLGGGCAAIWIVATIFDFMQVVKEK